MTQEVKATLEALNQKFEEFKASHEKQLAEIKASGSATAETTAEVTRLNVEVQNLTNRLRDMETESARPRNPEGDSTPQAQANRTAFFAYMRDGTMPSTDIRAALVEDATGRLIVPEDLEAGIRRTLGKVNVMRRLATVRTTQREKIRRRRLTEVTVGWGKLETGASLVESTPTPTEEFLWVEDMYGLVRVGEDELADTDIDLAETLEDSFGRATAEKEETAFVLGLGHGSNQPEGFTLGATVTRVTAGQNAAITPNDLLALMYAVPGAYRRNGTFLVNSATELKMRQFKDTAGQYLWQPTLTEGRPATFAGRPVENQEDLVNIPTAGTAADVAAFGDWKQGYTIVDRLRITIKRLNELYASAGMVGFLAHQRVGGGVVEAAALRILRVPA